MNLELALAIDMRLLPRLLKLCLLLGTVSLIVEGILESKKLVLPFVRPPSVPGESKILEHFALQHLAWPFIAFCFVFQPALLQDIYASLFARVFFAVLFVVLIIPELIVSLKSDLFRPYPFDIKIGFLKRIEMVRLGNGSVNILQLSHLLFSHVLLAVLFLLCAVNSALLEFFAGPLTGAGFR